MISGKPVTLRILICVLGLLIANYMHAQDNYEIQVYPSETVEKGVTMLELHSNYTGIGSNMVTDGIRPTAGAFHETIEITHGFTPWFEVGFYFFTSINRGYGLNWVGDHIRPRVMAPESWKWPVGVSLSTEIGYQRREYSTDTWTLEIRPIIDKKLGKWYFSLNPTIEYGLVGLDAGKPGVFSPNFKFSYDISKKVALGIEYYGSLGYLSGFDPFPQQEHLLFPSIDLNLSPDWEFNFGAGYALTQKSDNLIFKMILGRRLGKK
jgi:hypothetical protein